LVKSYREEYSKDFLIEDIEIDIASTLEPVLHLYQKQRDQKSYKIKTGMEFYTPSRNLVFASLSTMIGEILAHYHHRHFDAVEIALGIHKHTNAKEGGAYEKDYWDITPQFAEKLTELLSLNNVIPVSLYTPYVDSYKVDIVKDAIKLKVPIHSTWTCYDPKENDLGGFEPCGVCESCVERQNAGIQAGFENINDYIIFPS
jgi:7-cyano-7-deazaguanine synthase